MAGGGAKDQLGTVRPRHGGLHGYALEEIAKKGVKLGLVENAPRGQETQDFAAAAVNVQLDNLRRKGTGGVRRLAGEFAKATCRPALFSGHGKTGPEGDLVDDEMGRVLQVPGWSNIFTQPIINRIEMLSTGVRTDIGVKVFGADLETIDRVCKDIEAVLKPINGARDVIAGRSWARATCRSTSTAKRPHVMESRRRHPE